MDILTLIANSPRNVRARQEAARRLGGQVAGLQLQPPTASAIAPKMSRQIKAAFPAQGFPVGDYVPGTANPSIRPYKYTKNDYPVVSHLAGIEAGERSQASFRTKRFNQQIGRLQPGDDIAFYGTGDDVILAKVDQTGSIPQEIFYSSVDNPRASQARTDYYQAEGGTPKYTNVNLFGVINPKVIPVDQPFSQSKFEQRPIPGNARTVNFTPAEEGVVRGKQLPLSQQAQILAARQKVNYPEVNTGFYSDNAFGWGRSPIPKQGNNLNLQQNPYYPPEVLAGMDKVNVDGAIRNVIWQNRGKGGVVPTVFDAGRNQVDITPENFGGETSLTFANNANQPVYVAEKYSAAMRNNPQKFGINYPLESYNRERIPGRNINRYQTQFIPEAGGYEPMYRMQGVDAVLGDVDRLYAQSPGSELTEAYRGSSQEPGLSAIEEQARRSGSGTYVNPTYNNLLDDVDPFSNVEKLYSGSQADTRIDKVRSGYVPFNKPRSPHEYVPSSIDVLEDDFAMDSRGFIVANPSGRNSVPPPSQFLSNAPQRVTDNRNANVQRLVPEEQLPGLPAYSYTRVNPYGIAEEFAEFPNPEFGSQSTSVPPAFVRREAGESGKGRWLGGGLSPNAKYNDRQNSGLVDPLNSNYQIPNRQNWQRVRPAQDPLVKQARVAQLVARKAEAQLPLEQQIRIPEYSINNTGRGIAPDATSVNIPGAELPVAMRIGDDIEYTEVPYQGTERGNRVINFNTPQGESPVNYTNLDEDLANVRIRLGDRSYPLTPEATQPDYLPSKKQLQEGKQDIYGNILITPREGEVDLIRQRGVLNFSPDRDLVELGQRAPRQEVWANPDIEPTDIISALDSYQAKRNRIAASINNLDRLEAQQEGRTRASRFADEDAYRSAYDYNELDSEYVSPNDLNDILFSDPERVVTAAQLRQELTQVDNDIANAQSAYKQLMNLEPASEIQVIAEPGSEVKAKRLGNQFNEYGMRITGVPGESSEFSGTGSLPVGMPGENMLDLPSRYSLESLGQEDREIVIPTRELRPLKTENRRRLKQATNLGSRNQPQQDFDSAVTLKDQNRFVQQPQTPVEKFDAIVQAQNQTQINSPIVVTPTQQPSYISAEQFQQMLQQQMPTQDPIVAALAAQEQPSYRQSASSYVPPQSEYTANPQPQPQGRQMIPWWQLAAAGVPLTAGLGYLYQQGNRPETDNYVESRYY